MNTPVTDFHQLSEDYRRIERAIQYLEKHANRQPELNEIANAVGLSEYHFQRIFSSWAGISPKRFMQFLTKEQAKQLSSTSLKIYWKPRIKPDFRAWGGSMIFLFPLKP